MVGRSCLWCAVSFARYNNDQALLFFILRYRSRIALTRILHSNMCVWWSGRIAEQHWTVRRKHIYLHPNSIKRHRYYFRMLIYLHLFSVGVSSWVGYYIFMCKEWEYGIGKVAAADGLTTSPNKLYIYNLLSYSECGIKYWNVFKRIMSFCFAMEAARLPQIPFPNYFIKY